MSPQSRKRESYSAWLVALVLSVAAGALIFSLQVPTADAERPGGLYALTAASQALAAVLGLVLATSAVVAQLRALLSRRTLGFGGLRQVFGWSTVVMVVGYGVVIWLQLAMVGQNRVDGFVVQLLLTASAVCLSGLAPYLAQMRERLSPLSSLEELEGRLQNSIDDQEVALMRIADIEDFALNAVKQHDYATLRRSLNGLRQMLVGSVAAPDLEVGAASADALRKIALVGFDDPLAVPLVLDSIQQAVHELCAEGLTAQRAAAAEHIAQATQRIADKAVLATAAAEAAVCADILGEVGEELSLHGWMQESASAVGGLHQLKSGSNGERLQNVSARAASHLARIRPGASTEEPWPRRRANEQEETNLLLNASFEFGHDFGYGLEPGWYKGPFAHSMWMKAEPFASVAREGQYFLRAVAETRNQSIAQDVDVESGLGDSYVAICRAAAADEQTVRGRFALWGLGAPEERGEVRFTLSPSRGGEQAGPADKRARWQVLRAPLDVRAASHGALRVEIYVDSSEVQARSGQPGAPEAGGHILFDEAAIVPVHLRNGSFELEELGPWQLDSPQGRGRCEVRQHEWSPEEVGGEWYARLLPEGGPLSIWQTVQLPLRGGRMYEMSASIRATEEPVPISVDVRRDHEQVAQATFEAGRGWRHVYMPFALPPSDDGDSATCEVRLTVDGNPVEVDDLTIVPTLLFDSDLTQLDRWRMSPSTEVGVGEQHPDVGGATRRVSGGNGRALLWQDMPVTPRVGSSYHLAARVRLVDSSIESPQLTLQVVAKDREEREVGRSRTSAMLTADWDVVDVPFDCRRGDIHYLSALVELEAGVTADLAGITCNPLLLSAVP